MARSVSNLLPESRSLALRAIRPTASTHRRETRMKPDKTAAAFICVGLPPCQAGLPSWADCVGRPRGPTAWADCVTASSHSLHATPYPPYPPYPPYSPYSPYSPYPPWPPAKGCKLHAPGNELTNEIECACTPSLVRTRLYAPSCRMNLVLMALRKSELRKS